MTKTLKPVLAMSVAALTLLAGCAKGDANTAWSKTKAELKNTYSVKSWDHCEYAHFDAAKGAKAIDNEDLAKKTKEAGNSVALSFTFTLKDGKTVSGFSVYGVKDKELVTNFVAAGLTYATYSAAAAKEAAGYTAGTLVK